MPDRENIIKGLTEISEYARAKADIAGIGKGKEVFDSWYRAVEDARELLREQETVIMKPCYFNYICSGCGSEIDGEFIDYTGGKIEFCPYCGRKVKWSG